MTDHTPDSATPPSPAQMEDVRKEAMEFAGIGMYRYTFDGRITYIDHGAMRILEIERQYESPNDVIGKTIGELIIYTLPKGYLREQIKKNKRVRGLEYEFLTLARKRKFAIHDSFLVQDSPSSEEVIQVIIRDITEQKLAAEEKAELVDQLSRSQRMEAVGQLAGGIAHDFNNILQAIQGYTEYALENLDPKSEVKDELQEILHASGKATSLVRQLLAFSRRELYHPEIINLPDQVSDILKMIQRVLGEHIELAADYGTEDAAIYADISQIEQVMMNLCVNARDAMPEGGTLGIHIAPAEFDESSCRENPWASPGRYAELKISDTGTGMPRAIQERIFEPFFTTKGVGEGSGLGLATVYGIVKRHNGFMHLTSHEGEGTIFKLYFPIVDFEPDKLESSAARPDDLKGTETILVAEDDDLVRKLTVRILQAAGYTVIHAEDGQQAVKAYDEHCSRIDVCLLDIVMPKLSGRAVYDHVRKNAPNLPIIFFSGHDFNILSDKMLPESDMILIRKPFARVELLTKLREALDNAPSPDNI